MARLSLRQQQVLALVEQGLLLKEISDRLGISLNTVKKHLKALYRKCESHSARQALHFCRVHHWLPVVTTAFVATAPAPGSSTATWSKTAE